jgi:GntR family transcriptional regulator
VIPFRLTFRPGIPLYEQVVYAARKAIVSGQLRPGDAFPSVRALSRELQINPNTAHRVIAGLTTQGLLEIRSGIGAVVAAIPQATVAACAALLGNEIEALVVEAKQLGIPLKDVTAAVADHWERLTGPESAVPANPQGVETE